MPLLTTVASGGVKGLGWSSPPLGEELGGMVLLKPTSIDYTGTSATVGADGTVDFSDATSLSLNGIFSANYDNYMFQITSFSSASRPDFRWRLRASGGPDESGSYYNRQYIYANSSAIALNRDASPTTFAQIITTSSTNISGATGYFYGPFLASPTSGRTLCTVGDGMLIEHIYTQSLSVSYDGFTLIPNSGTATGSISVYGLVGA